MKVTKIEISFRFLTIHSPLLQKGKKDQFIQVKGVSTIIS
jgi:hypothetical protein